jgi:hypothetical protein
MRSVSVKGSPYAWFRRSIESGRAVDAWAAAHELEALSLADALALCLVLLDEDPERFDRSAVRWLTRLAADGGLDLAGLALASSSLAALRARDRAAPAAALRALLEHRGDRRACEELDAWDRRRR